VTLPRSLTAAYNQRTGDAAEQAWCDELTRRGAQVWRVNAGTSARHNQDVFLLWDVLAMTDTDAMFCQVKATATDPWPPAPIWRTRFMAARHPKGLRYLLVWLDPSGQWRVWRLLSDGTRLPLAWPPERSAS
ncbi:MAG TPA: hypothetical protein VIU62_16860, partial [Chloroflexota bacterium]